MLLFVDLAEVPLLPLPLSFKAVVRLLVHLLSLLLLIESWTACTNGLLIPLKVRLFFITFFEALDHYDFFPLIGDIFGRNVLLRHLLVVLVWTVLCGNHSNHAERVSLLRTDTVLGHAGRDR